MENAGERHSIDVEGDGLWNWEEEEESRICVGVAFS